MFGQRLYLSFLFHKGPYVNKPVCGLGTIFKSAHALFRLPLSRYSQTRARSLLILRVKWASGKALLGVLFLWFPVTFLAALPFCLCHAATSLFLLVLHEDVFCFPHIFSQSSPGSVSIKSMSQAEVYRSSSLMCTSVCVEMFSFLVRIFLFL